MSAYRTRFVADNDAVYEQSKLRVLFGFFFFSPQNWRVLWKWEWYYGMDSLSTNAVADKHLVTYPIRCSLYTPLYEGCFMQSRRITVNNPNMPLLKRNTQTCFNNGATHVDALDELCPQNIGAVLRCSSVDIDPFYL